MNIKGRVSLDMTPGSCSTLNDGLLFMQAMRADAEEKKLPPIYRRKWADATPEEVQAEMDKGTPFCYRFRVPKVALLSHSADTTAYVSVSIL